MNTIAFFQGPRDRSAPYSLSLTLPVMRFILWFFAALLSAQCSAQIPTKSITLGRQHVVILADSALAAEYIIADSTDRFFERVTAVEMSIQMKKPLNQQVSSADLATEYRRFLQSDMDGFTADEAKMVEKTLRQIYPHCTRLRPDIFPDTLVLIKTKALHYGEGVYYTRENTIVIPYNALAGDRDAFKTTLYHELFHVFSRLNPDKRRALYQRIGFSGLGYDRLELPPLLAARVLHNPDGVDFAQVIELSQPQRPAILAVPIIYANEPGYKADKPAFFSYLTFELFQVKETGDGRWRVLTKPDGLSSTLDLRSQPDFFRQIGDNTGYIIHPDEVLADNFAFLMEELERGEPVKKFSEAGRQLLRDLEAALRR